jgi:DNA-binding MarR family transcriptional regulator
MGRTELVDVSVVAADLRVVLSQLARRMRAQTGAVDLTRSQSSVLLRLEKDGPATMTALARAEGVRPQSMSVTVSALESLGLVSGAPDPNDGRKTVLSLTESAREQFATGRLAKQDWLAAALRAQLSPAEQAELASCLPLLRRLANST